MFRNFFDAAELRCKKTLLTWPICSCVFFAFNHASFILGVVASVAVVVVQFALKVNFDTVSQE